MSPLIKHSLKLFALPVFLAGALSLVYCLPDRGEIAESSVIMDIPLGNNLSGWRGEPRQESDQERAILAADTVFSKGDYIDLSLGRYAPLYAVNLSIVLSGVDMNASIHRPELCLPSQGHYNLMPHTRSVLLDNGKKVTFTVLESSINISKDPKRPHIIHSFNYYIFVGHKTLTHSHEWRVLKDAKRRIIHGQDQRWAYIQAGILYGNLPLTNGSTINIEEAKAKETLEKFLAAILPRIVKWEEIED